MKLKQVGDHCDAVLNGANRVCDANSGLANLGEGLVVDALSPLDRILALEPATIVPGYGPCAVSMG
jgi:hypothetical protein